MILKIKIYLLLIVTAVLIISCKGKREKIVSISQLNGKKICVLTGSAGDITARAKYPEAQFFDMAGSTDAALAVKTGKVDAFIYDKSVLNKIIEKNPDLMILDKPVNRLEVAIAFNKQNTELRNKFNVVLAELNNSGKLVELKKKWIDSKYNSPPIVEFNNNNSDGILKMGTCAIYEPFTFISNSKYTGMDFELTKLIAEKLNKKIEIVDMNFDALIPSLQSGKIDFAISNFNITEERKKSISYSDPYVSNDISVLVKK